MSPRFAALRAPVDRSVHLLCVDLWLRTSAALRRLSRAAIRLPDRGPGASADEPPPEFFRFPPF